MSTKNKCNTILNGLKIKINVIWDKDNRYGEVWAEAFYEYFCSGELSVLPENVFSIPVRCKPITKYDRTFNCIKDYMTVNVLLADDILCSNDRNRILANSLEKIKNENSVYIPVALSKNGCDYIDKNECITAYQGEDDCIESDRRKTELNKIKSRLPEQNRNYIIMVLRRTLERISGKYFHLVENAENENIKLFICHTKSSGKKELDLIRSYLACNTCASSFVDVNSIMLGDKFNKEIYKEVIQRAMLVIATDNISGKEWCLKEIKMAKEHNMPIIIVDAYKTIDNRLFPYIGNCPVVRLVSNKSEVKNGAIIYEALVNEILWNTLNLHKNRHRENEKVLPRKIELLDVVLLEDKYKSLIYPEPPLPFTEKSIIDEAISKLKRKIEFKTEISAATEKYQGFNPKVMISSSSNPDYQRVDGENCCVGINYAVKEITKYLIYMGCTILNAGNYEDDGFNRVIMKQLSNYSSLSKINNAKCIHYVNAFKYGNRNNGDFIRFNGEFDKELIKFENVAADAKNNKDAMRMVRDRITTDTDILIVIGGMKSSNGGRTGIDDEVDFAIKKKKSIYLLGGFGFKAKELCEKYVNAENLQKLNSGLQLGEYKKLANMYDISDILEMIFKGLATVSNNNKLTYNN